ncbi:hypothetical protein VB04_001175 [Salmonella enterica subsp. enterica serovar Minnesota]|uniref:Uncharacterized protein n=1 Tax=Salmonella enterica TaxID=28901 RepID=A0A763YIN1_SALER|nr:hypothetical protein [Salmonella enterica subsp. enterica serovar Minnesota]EIE6434768.1 hypothetical protein [Salmonella enterica]EED5837252.1 hypothetical protein [Salmonella enterica subsp. enterica serovar Minnesota]EIG1432000.1 hypothetical protein [Salmonella enterica]EIG1435278.1 hypothetical protein [Salmonella enterica]
MDVSRKQFLEWFGEEFESINNSEELHVQAIKMIAWQSWVKSRAAIEIELPAKNDISGDDHPIPDLVDWDDGRNAGIQECAEAIRAAGIKVKE